jgi:predicted kinase
MKATICIGVSASGKSVWASAQSKYTGAIVTNRDDLRFSLTGSKGWGDFKFNKQIESIVTDIQRATITSCSVLKKDIIIADTNLNERFREELIVFLRSKGFQVELKPFHVTLEEAWRRDSSRGNGVGHDVISRQYKDWLKYLGRKVYVPDLTLPKAVIFDIDGTLAHMNGRNPFQWEKVGTDTVDGHIAGLLDYYQKKGHRIILVSGRDSVCKEETVCWLSKHELTYYELFMRPAGDSRKDTIIKEEIFWDSIAPKYNVEVVFDDRPCVVRMWQELQIPKVIAVGDQSVEF